MALKWKVVSQRNWIKGLQATFSRFSQPQAVVVRLSNLLYDIRGGFRQADGSAIVTQYYPPIPNGGPIIEIALYSTGVANPYYMGLQKSGAGSAPLATPVLNSGFFYIDTNGQLGPLIAAGTVFQYYVTACDGLGGETPPSNFWRGSSASGPNAITLTWSAVPGAVGYNVYGRLVNQTGQINQDGASYSGLVKGTTFNDLGTPATPYTNTPPTMNSTQALQLYYLPPADYGAAELQQNFPSFLAPPLGYLPGAPNPPSSNVPGASANGGLVGFTGPLSQIVQFANRLIFALGNGYPPQEFTDTSLGGSGLVVAVGNSYNAQYPDWQASVAWNQGDSIHDSVSGGVFTAQNGGTSGTTRPQFNNSLNAMTAESSPGTVTWKCVATSATGTPLRGAAHAIVYAGSLWIGNTYPTTTSDELDGPCCLKMSDVNNPESWNPANIAFLDRDDGDEITALAKYTIAEIGIAPTGSLVVFKNFSTYQVTGVFGASDFSIQNAQTDMGCVAGRTATFVPGFGVTRLTHLGFAYFQGVSDKLISEEIRPYLFGGQPDITPIDWNYVYLSRAAQAATPPLYVAACPIAQPVLTGVQVSGNTTPGNPVYQVYVRVEQLINGVPVAVSPEYNVQYSGTPGFIISTPNLSNSTYRVFAGIAPGGENLYIEQPVFTFQFVALSSMTPGYMNLGVGGLTRIFCYDLVLKQWAVVDIPFQISCLKQIRSPGTIPITLAAGANDGIVRRLFAGDLVWDNGSQVQWSFRASELFQDSGTAKMFYRRLILRGSNALNSNLVVTVSLQGTDRVMGKGAGRTVLGGPNNAPQWEMRVDIMKDAENANAQISGSGPVQIQIEAIDWHVSPKPSGTPVTIQR